jgi:D-arginine dehydrogenase
MDTGMVRCDVIIIGAGIAGASLAWAIGGKRNVIVLEREAQPGHHATGRSAAIFVESYGNASVRALTRASRPFFATPPAGFADERLWRRRGMLHIATREQLPNLDKLAAAINVTDGEFEWVEPDEIPAQAPILEKAGLARAILEKNVWDLDVDAIHQGYLRQARNDGAEFRTDCAAESIELSGGCWRVKSKDEVFESPVLVNAAGAWADEIARAAGVAPLNLSPLRRTALLIEAPQGKMIEDWPAVVDSDEAFYFKPDAGNLLLSPADETASPPCDAQPDELDIAIAVDRFEKATGHSVKRVKSRWAGLRTFAPDRTPVIGFDAIADGFFWLAGQGGYGIQTSPAMGVGAARLILGGGARTDLPLDEDTLAQLSPKRF